MPFEGVLDSRSATSACTDHLELKVLVMEPEDLETFAKLVKPFAQDSAMGLCAVAVIRRQVCYPVVAFVMSEDLRCVLLEEELLSTEVPSKSKATPGWSSLG
jgi:hypothetical protein